MKKFFSVLLSVLCVAMLCLTLTACSDAGAPKYDVSNAEFDIPVETLQVSLDEFLSDGREDRTTGTSAERRAAVYLENKLISFGYAAADVETIDFSIVESESSKIESQHVTAVYRSARTDAKNVVIGAYYDNRYAIPTSTIVGAEASINRSNGALSNGTGVATLLSLAEYFAVNKPALEFDVTFAFFGASSSSSKGVSKYLEATGGASDVLCMIELDRLGVDHVYAYSDARETKREALFDRVAQENDLDVYKVTQKTPQIVGMSVLDGVPYYQWAMGGLFPTFFNRGIPTLAVIGANWETIDLTDTESANSENISFTSNDTLENLKKLHPDYGTKMATAATLVIQSITDGEFLSAVQYDKANFPNTSVLTKRWVWELVVIGIIVIAAAIMMLVTSYLAKKYKPQAPQPLKNVKMAVFGMDYEDKTGDNIYIDIKDSGSPFEDIFPGIPNNDKEQTIRPNDTKNDNDPFSDYPDPPSDSK